MPAKPAFDHSVHKLWILLDQTYFAASKCQEAIFASAGLTLQQYRLLMVVECARGPVTPTDVARWLDRNTNSISLLIDRMERFDLITRVRDLKDRRAQRLVITTKGEKLYKQATKGGLELMEKMQHCCTEEEFQTLTRLLNKLRESALKELIPEDAAREAKMNGANDYAHSTAKKGRSKNKIASSV